MKATRKPRALILTLTPNLSTQRAVDSLSLIHVLSFYETISCHPVGFNPVLHKAPVPETLTFKIAKPKPSDCITGLCCNRKWVLVPLPSTPSTTPTPTRLRYLPYFFSKLRLFFNLGPFCLLSSKVLPFVLALRHVRQRLTLIFGSFYQLGPPPQNRVSHGPPRSR